MTAKHGQGRPVAEERAMLKNEGPTPSDVSARQALRVSGPARRPDYYSRAAMRRGRGVLDEQGGVAYPGRCEEGRVRR